MKSSKKVLIAFGAAIVVALIALLVSGIYNYVENAERSVPFTLLNDTNEAVEVGACASGGPKPPINPGQTDTYYAYASDPNAACGFLTQ